MTHAELLRSHANLAIKEGGMYYSGEYLSRIATVAESLEAENAKLRECLQDFADTIKNDDGFGVDLGWMLDRMRELGIEIDE